jgi:hypothetical protein
MIKFILQIIIVPIDNRIEVAIHYEIKRSPKLIVQNALGSGGHLVVSSKEIFSIVGRDWGLGCKHASAIFIMWTTPSAAPFLGSEMRWSNTSFNGVCWAIGGIDDDDEDPGDKSAEMRSPGCLPVITSIVTTPKL